MPDQQTVVFTYHKTGTVLFENLLRRTGAELAVVYGHAPTVPERPEAVVMAHSLVDHLPSRPFRAIRMIRDPRDIWVSGYRYHLRGAEPWCRNTDFDDRAPIDFPRVPAVFRHRRERWKRDYLRGLAGRSYQANLLALDRDAGLRFELDRYTGATLEAMRDWRFAGDPRILDVRLEDVAADFDGTLTRVFRHLGFPEDRLPSLLAAAAAEDAGRMDDATLAANPHIQGRDPSTWRQFLTPDLVALIEARFGDVIARLGYQ